MVNGNLLLFLGSTNGFNQWLLIFAPRRCGVHRFLPLRSGRLWRPKAAQHHGEIQRSQRRLGTHGIHGPQSKCPRSHSLPRQTLCVWWAQNTQVNDLNDFLIFSALSITLGKCVHARYSDWHSVSPLVIYWENRGLVSWLYLLVEATGLSLQGHFRISGNTMRSHSQVNQHLHAINQHFAHNLNFFFFTNAYTYHLDLLNQFWMMWNPIWLHEVFINFMNALEEWMFLAYAYINHCTEWFNKIYLIIVLNVLMHSKAIHNPCFYVNFSPLQHQLC